MLFSLDFDNLVAILSNVGCVVLPSAESDIEFNFEFGNDESVITFSLVVAGRLFRNGFSC